MDRDKAIRAARLTLGGMLEKKRHATAVSRADGQIAPSKYLPNVPRAVHADGGRVGYEDGGDVGGTEPKNTVKAYKLFKRKKDGNIYPLFVNANKPVAIGQWLDAEEGPQGKTEGKVKSSLGDLAYRPGWHAGDLPVATHIGGKSSKELTAPDYRPDDHVWAEVEMPNDVDWQSVANSRMRRTQDGRPILNTAHITDQNNTQITAFQRLPRSSARASKASNIQNTGMTYRMPTIGIQMFGSVMVPPHHAVTAAPLVSCLDTNLHWAGAEKQDHAAQDQRHPRHDAKNVFSFLAHFFAIRTMVPLVPSA